MVKVWLYLYSLGDGNKVLPRTELGKYFRFYDVETGEYKTVNKLESKEIIAKDIVLNFIRDKNSSIDYLVEQSVRGRNSYLSFVYGYDWLFTTVGNINLPSRCFIGSRVIENIKNLDKDILERIGCYIPKVEDWQKKFISYSTLKRKLLGLPYGFGKVNTVLYDGYSSIEMFVELESEIVEDSNFYASIFPENMVDDVAIEKIRNKVCVKFRFNKKYIDKFYHWGNLSDLIGTIEEVQPPLCVPTLDRYFLENEIKYRVVPKATLDKVLGK